MKIFSRDIVNDKRQFEFDFAKFICIFGMVITHCFEELLASSGANTTFYYLFVIILDCVFGAGIFMSCMGLGLSYGHNNDTNKIIKRGLSIFVLGYLLNIIREGIPYTILVLATGNKDLIRIIISDSLCNDILLFAGLALMLFGLLKKLKVSDLFIFLISLAMSIIGSFFRFIDFGNDVVNSLAGLFIGTYSEGWEYTIAAFPLFNWFIVVVFGYLFAKGFKHCQNKTLFYAIASPIAILVITIYLLLAIPNKFDMMSGDLLYYYQFATPNIFILISGFIFASGLYYFISLLFNEKIKKAITKVSTNINRIYCIHWIIIGWIETILFGLDAFIKKDFIAALVALLIFVISSLLAELYVHIKNRKKADFKKNIEKSEQNIK